MEVVLESLEQNCCHGLCLACSEMGSSLSSQTGLEGWAEVWMLSLPTLEAQSC